MPITPTYPGVYVEEIPSGVRTITGVATSITAFIGRAKRGPVNEPETIFSYADYERSFGGLDLKSAMSFAVQDFYLNGGGAAIITRLVHADAQKATLDVNVLVLQAASEGEWGNNLKATVTDVTNQEVADSLGVDLAKLFNLIVEDAKTGAREEYLNVSAVEGPRQIDKVLADKSDLVTVSTLPAGRPPGGEYTVDSNDAAKKGIDGGPLEIGDYTGNSAGKKGLYALEQVDLFNLLCLPPDWNETNDPTYPGTLLAEATTYCEKKRAMMIVDPPSEWNDMGDARDNLDADIGNTSKNACIFFPRLRKPNPLRDNQKESFVPCGAVAGVMARTDAQRGVWKAPAGMEATLRGVRELTVGLTDDENGALNPLGVNCLRSFPVTGRVVWGARTLRGADQLASEWKYIPIRRLALFIEETLFRGTKWVVFEPNDEPLWAQIRLNLGSFMNNLFRQGAFQGSTPKEAYFVKCDKETTPPSDQDKGIVNIAVGFAPLKPAEFVIIKIQQIASELNV